MFENEPLIEVTAPIAEAQLVETYLLNQITFQTAIASKAARCRVAAQGRSLVEFGFRRTHGVDAAMAAARVSAITGFAATSNVAAARRYGLATSGTMAHSYVEAFESEDAAFRAFATDFPHDPTFLIDTYDAASGVESAIRVARERGLCDKFSVRLDSGDLDSLARQIRKQLDAAGCRGARIFASGGLDEYVIHSLVGNGAPVDAFGVGTRLGVSADAPSLDSAYKLVAYDGRPLLKLSAGKSTLPGAKQVFRNLDLGRDVVGLREEQVPGRHPLLHPVMRAGRRLEQPETIETMAARVTREIWALPDSALSIQHPEAPPVMVSAGLKRLRKECVARISADSGAGNAGNHQIAAKMAPEDARVLACTTVVMLRDGSRIGIRPIMRRDSEAILRGFEDLSQASRRRRFFNPPTTLSDSMLRYLTTVAHTNHVALGAFVVDASGRPGVAIARYARLTDDTAGAEAAVTVLETYRRRGIATVLLEALALVARRCGIQRFCGYVQWENDDALNLARSLGAHIQHDSPGVARFDIPVCGAELARLSYPSGRRSVSSRNAPSRSLPMRRRLKRALSRLKR